MNDNVRRGVRTASRMRRATRYEGAAPTDAELVVRSWEQPEAFDEIFRRHEGVIYRYLLQRVGPDAAGDITAEVFAQAFRGRRGYRTTYASARPWLFGIATNLVRKYFRNRSRANSLHRRLVSHDLGLAADTVADSNNRVDANRDHEQLADSLLRLRPDDRAVLIAYAVCEMSYQEIAEAFDIPIGTVRSRMSRARRKVRSRLGDGYRDAGSG